MFVKVSPLFDQGNELKKSVTNKKEGHLSMFIFYHTNKISTVVLIMIIMMMIMTHTYTEECFPNISAMSKTLKKNFVNSERKTLTKQTKHIKYKNKTNPAN